MDDYRFPRTGNLRPSVPWRRTARRAHARKPLFSYAERLALQQGTYSTMYHALGAHLDEVDGVAGTRFAVWAPNACEVSLLCNGNGWTHGRNLLRSSDSGVWSGFMPGIGQGEPYKFGIQTQAGQRLEKADPLAFYSELRPKTASIVYDLSGFDWSDGQWMRNRESADWLSRPISVYEVHLGSWRHPADGRRYFNYRELAHMLVDYVQELGYSHIELMPVSEYPFDGSWGYQSTGYFAPTSRYGTPHDFMYFVDYCHQAGIGLMIDWVPAHFPTDAHSLGWFDGTCLYEHSDPRKGYHPDWGTLIFNYGRHEVRDFLLSSARFWLDVYHIDGLRVDAVASMLYLDYSRKEGEWVPNIHGGRENLEALQFLRDMNTILHRDFPGVLTIAEESTAWGGVSRPVDTGGLGFSMKWDMGWMNDTLRYLHRESVHRSHHQDELSFRMIYAFTENFILPLSHDEVVHGKRSLLSQMPGDAWQQFANLRLLFGYQYTMPGKKLLFMGGELGQWAEWNHDGQLDWALEEHRYHACLRRLVKDLNGLYKSQPALYRNDFDSSGFTWIQCDDWQNSVYAFQRMTGAGSGERGAGSAECGDIDAPRSEFRAPSSELLIVACNFTPVPRKKYRIGVPIPGFYAELLNTDSDIYGGGNIGNGGGVQSEPLPTHGRQHSIELTLPPLAMVVLKPSA